MTGKEISKWSDSFMFTAEESKAEDGPKVYLLGGPNDPLGHIAACAKMYKGEVVRDLRDVTDAERREYLVQIQKTVLKMPLESVQLHFMVEGVTRGFTHQMVRQRTAAYAQESTRFAVKEDMKTATALPPSLADTMSLQAYAETENLSRGELGLQMYKKDDGSDDWDAFVHECWVQAMNEGGPQAARLRWDEAVDVMGSAYMDMVNSGIPAEDARGLLPTNITTRLNYITNLRSWYDTMAVRVSDQAQFEWRAVAMHMALAMRTYGEGAVYSHWMREDEIDLADWEGEDYDILQDRAETIQIDGMPVEARFFLVRRSSYWQYEALSNELKPIEFKIGGPAFGANFDRPSRIGERVREFAKHGVPSSEWTSGSVEHGIPPIRPEEWLLDPNSARLAQGQEFDAFGNRVPEGTGWHFVEHGILGKPAHRPTLPPMAARWPRDFDEQGRYTTDNKPGVSGKEG